MVNHSDEGSDVIVRIDRLRRRFQDRLALDDVSFGVPRSTLLALLGPNGSGKTTLIRILTTVLRPTSGSAFVDGVDVVHQPRDVLRKIGVVFQKPALDGKLTVRENLLHQGYLYGLSGRELRRRSDALLDRFGLANRSSDRVDRLSGGLQRRVELAKALLHQPGILILDEPSTGLDPGARKSFMNTLRELRDRDGVTSLLSTHLMEEADRCDIVAVLNEGKLVAMENPDSLKSAIDGDVITVHAQDPARVAAGVQSKFSIPASVVEGVVRIEGKMGHAFIPRLVEAFPGEVDSVTVGRPSLEDVFIHLTGRGLWAVPEDELKNREAGE